MKNQNASAEYPHIPAKGSLQAAMPMAAPPPPPPRGGGGGGGLFYIRMYQYSTPSRAAMPRV